jgi:hypothetical protein
LTIWATDVPHAAAASSAVRVLWGISRISTGIPAAAAAALTRSVLLLLRAINAPALNCGALGSPLLLNLLVSSAGGVKRELRHE